MKQLNGEKAGSFEPALYPAGAVRHQPGGSLAACRRRRRFGQDAFVFLHPSRWRWGAGGPSLHPLDLAVGICCGAALRLAVYLKSKNAKKYRHNMEYGSARWSA